MSLRLAPHLVCNRLVKEDWEDREYKIHMKKINDIKNRRSKLGIYSSNSSIGIGNAASTSSHVRFPHIFNNPKKAQKLQEQKLEADKELHFIEQKIQRIRTHGSKIDHINKFYEAKKNREAAKNKNRNEIEVENERLGKKIAGMKGVYEVKKWNDEYESHRSFLKLNEKKFYTPRGMGYRKTASMQEVRLIKKNKKKNPIKMLNEAVNQHERGDIVLMKTLCKLNYYERMETKRKYEETYETDLKKGLIKVMDKQYEPLINALLTDTDANDIDKIYESLYDQNEAAIVITECLFSRNMEQTTSLLTNYQQKMDSRLDNEISDKIEGDVKTFLLAILQNKNLDGSKVDEERVKMDVKDLEDLNTFASDIFLNVIRTYSKKQLKRLLEEYHNVHKKDIFSKVDSTKPTTKAVKLIQNLLVNSHLYLAEKLQKTLKTNKNEFLRLIATYSQKDLDQIAHEYGKRYQVKLDNEVRDNFTADVTRLTLKILHKNSNAVSDNDNDDDDNK